MTNPDAGVSVKRGVGVYLFLKNAVLALGLGLGLVTLTLTLIAGTSLGVPAPTLLSPSGKTSFEKKKLKREK